MRMRVLRFVENIHQVFDETQRINGGGAVPIPYPELYQAAIDAFESEDAGFDASDVFEEIVKTLNAEDAEWKLRTIRLELCLSAYRGLPGKPGREGGFFKC